MRYELIGNNPNNRQLVGCTKFTTVCAWNGATVDKYVYNTKKVNLDTKFFFDNINDEDLITKMCEHYGVTKFYTYGDNINPVQQLCIIPANVYMFDGMRVGLWITSNYAGNMTFLLFGKYDNPIFDSVTEAAQNYFYEEFEKCLNCYYDYNNKFDDFDLKKQTLISNKRKELEDKYKEIIDIEINQYSKELECEQQLQQKKLTQRIESLKRKRYLIDSLKIDTNKYNILFDND